MTNQEIFDKVLTHLRKQGEAAMYGEECMYRTSDGLMCAVGCLMPDEVYRPSLERAAVTMLPHDVLFACGINPNDVEQLVLCSELQDVHDYNLAVYGVDEWERGMRDVAIQYGLTYTPPQEN